jgi:hypothetical protein
MNLLNNITSLYIKDIMCIKKFLIINFIINSHYLIVVFINVPLFLYLYNNKDCFEKIYK